MISPKTKTYQGGRGALHLLPIQVKLEAFQSLEEIDEWIAGKVALCEDASKPPRLHGNWQLCEYWFVHDRGVKRKRETMLQDQVERSAKDANSSAHCLGWPEQPLQSKGQKAAENGHKAAVNKVVQSLNRLGKGISLCESSLPSMRRSLEEKMYKSVKLGLGKCREMKETRMDNLGGPEDNQGWDGCGDHD